MTASHKRIFAGKPNLQPEPFCPYLTNESGYLSQRHHLSRKASSRSHTQNPRNMRPARGFRLFAGGENAHRL